jgi:hypothetical protein
MSDSNRIRVAYKVETTFGSTPASSAIQELRLTSESLHQEVAVETSGEIRRDRQIAEVVRSNISVAGDINFEFSATSYNDFLQWTLQSAGWSSLVTVTGTTLSAASGDQSFNDSANGFGTLQVGQWIRVTGFATAANNGVFKIVTKPTNGKITVTAGTTLITESAGPSVTIKMGEQVVNGTTLNSVHFERKYDDLTNIFARYTGVCFEGMSLAVNAESLITGGFSVIGKAEVSQTTSFGSSYTAPGTNPILNAIDHVLRITESNVEVDCTSWSFQLANNLRPRLQISDLGAVSVGAGTCEVSGTVQMYFNSSSVMDKMLGFTATSLAIILWDGTNGYVIEFPRVRFTGGQRVAGGQNQDIIADMSWQAYRHETEDVTIRIARLS